MNDLNFRNGLDNFYDVCTELNIGVRINILWERSMERLLWYYK